MSAKTKIVVLHMKELIYTAVFAVLGILFIILLVMMFLPGKDKDGFRACHGGSLLSLHTGHLYYGAGAGQRVHRCGGHRG